jgi:hypothetical protein
MAFFYKTGVKDAKTAFFVKQHFNKKGHFQLGNGLF